VKSAAPVRQAKTPATTSMPDAPRGMALTTPTTRKKRATPARTSALRRALILARRQRWQRVTRPRPPEQQPEIIPEPEPQPEEELAPNPPGGSRRALSEQMRQRWQQARQRSQQRAENQQPPLPPQPQPETKAERLAREKAEQEARQVPESGPRKAPELGEL